MKRILSSALVLLVSAGIVIAPLNTYAYTYTGGTKPAPTEITISSDPSGSWNEDKAFSNDSRIFTVNSPSAEEKYTAGQEITLSVTPYMYSYTVLPGGFQSNIDNNFVMTILKGDTVEKTFRVNYNKDETEKTFTDTFTPTEEGTYKVNIFYRGSTYSGSNFGNYYIQVEKETAVPAAEAKSETAVKVSGQSYQVLSDTAVAFTKASDKKSVTIPDTIKIKNKKYRVTAIAPGAFRGRKNLTGVTIGKNIRKIGKNAFYGCKRLKKITFKTTGLTSASVGANAFKGISKKAVIKSPKSKKAAYKKILLKKGMKKTMTFK